MQTWTVTEPYVKVACGLGEGPYYERATRSLRFVDIMKHRLHTVDLQAGPASLATLQLDTPVSVTADIAGVDPRERVVIGAKAGLAVLDRRTGAYEYLARYAAVGAAPNPRLRGNDGAVDPHGRFWIGTMTDFGQGPFEAEGSVHMFDGRKDAHVIKEGVKIPNTISWSVDGKTLYMTETTHNAIYAYDYAGPSSSSSGDGSSTGSPLSNERVFYKHERAGSPDGHRIDVEGNLWTAVYGGSCVLKVAPDGRVVGEVRLPTRNVTCVEFVGTELFITTARMDDGAGSPEEVDLSGSLFRVDVGVEGVPPNEFKVDL